MIGFLNGELGDPPGGWPEPFRTKALEGRTWKQPAAELTPEQSAGLDLRIGPRAARHPQPAALPGPDQGVHASRGRRTATSRCCPRSTTSTACAAGEEHEVDLDEGKTPADRPPGDQRARRARLPHRDVHHQRPDAPDQRSATATSPPRSRPPRRPTPRTAATWRRRSRASSRSASPRATRSRPAQTVATIEAMKMEASITAPRRRHGRAGRGAGHPGRRGRRPGAGARLSAVSPARAAWSGATLTVNHDDRRPSRVRRVSPVMVGATAGADERHVLRPGRPTRRCRRARRSRSRSGRRSAGSAARAPPSLTVLVQVWTALPDQPSYGSCLGDEVGRRAGRGPAAAAGGELGERRPPVVGQPLPGGVPDRLRSRPGARRSTPP